jgi:DNA-binding NarL/FixJ family response regulator
MEVGPARVRLLLVDDNEEFLRAESAWIGVQPGFEVVATARSGEAALEVVQRLRPDIVLMDLAMPGMGGFEAIRALKQRPSPPAIVAVSLHDGQVVRSEAAMAGADGFVPKARLSALLVPTLREVQGAARLETKASEQPAEALPREQRPQHGAEASALPPPGAASGSRHADAGAWARLRATASAWWSNAGWARPRRTGTEGAPGWLPRSAR